MRGLHQTVVCVPSEFVDDSGDGDRCAILSVTSDQKLALQMTKSLLGCLTIMTLIGCDAVANGIPYEDIEKVKTGSLVYASNCSGCHGPNLEGQPNWQRRDPNGFVLAPPHDETGHTWHHADQMLFEIIKYGPQKFLGADYKSMMPAYEGKLSDEEIWSVLAFIKSKWPEAIQKKHTEVFSKN